MRSVGNQVSIISTATLVEKEKLSDQLSGVTLVVRHQTVSGVRSGTTLVLAV